MEKGMEKHMNFIVFVQFICDRYGISSNEVIKVDRFKELGLDSLTLYSLLGDVEERYGVNIDVDDLSEIDTVRKMYSYIVGLKQ